MRIIIIYFILKSYFVLLLLTLLGCLGFIVVVVWYHSFTVLVCAVCLCVDAVSVCPSLEWVWGRGRLCCWVGCTVCLLNDRAAILCGLPGPRPWAYCLSCCFPLLSTDREGGRSRLVWPLWMWLPLIMLAVPFPPCVCWLWAWSTFGVIWLCFVLFVYIFRKLCLRQF